MTIDRIERASAPLRLYDKIPHDIFPKLEAAGLTDVCHYRLLDKISYSDACNAGRGCIMSNAYFMRDMGLTDYRLKKLLRGLEEAGFIRRETARGGDAEHGTRRRIHPSDSVRTAWIDKYRVSGMTAIVSHCEALEQEESSFRDPSPDGEPGSGEGGQILAPPGGKTPPIEYTKSNRIMLSEPKGSDNDERLAARTAAGGSPARAVKGRNGGPDMAASLREQLPGAGGAPDHRAREQTWEGATEESRVVLDLWNAIGCGVQHRPSGPGARKALYALDRLFSQGWVVDKVVDAVIRFSNMAGEPDRYGLPFARGQRLSLVDFVTVPKFLKQRAYKWGRPEPEPLLKKLYRANGGDDGLDEYTEDEEKIYRKLKRVYASWCRGVKPADAQFSRREELDLLRAAAKLKRCHAKGWLDPFFAEGQRPSYDDYADVLFRGLKRKYGTDYGTGNVASDFTWNDLMPKFIQEDYGASVIEAVGRG